MTTSGKYIIRGQHLSSLASLVSVLILGAREHFPNDGIKVPFTKASISYGIVFILYIYGWWAINLIFGIEYDWRLTYSTLAGWFYLRYYMRTKVFLQPGDSRKEFGLLEPLPNRIREWIFPIESKIHRLAIKIGIIPNQKKQEKMI